MHIDRLVVLIMMIDCRSMFKRAVLIKAVIAGGSSEMGGGRGTCERMTRFMAAGLMVTASSVRQRASDLNCHSR